MSSRLGMSLTTSLVLVMSTFFPTSPNITAEFPDHKAGQCEGTGLMVLPTASDDGAFPSVSPTTRGDVQSLPSAASPLIFLLGLHITALFLLHLRQVYGGTVSRACASVQAACVDLESRVPAKYRALCHRTMDLQPYCSIVSRLGLSLLLPDALVHSPAWSFVLENLTACIGALLWAMLTRPSALTTQLHRQRHDQNPELLKKALADVHQRAKELCKMTLVREYAFQSAYGRQAKLKEEVKALKASNAIFEWRSERIDALAEQLEDFKVNYRALESALTEREGEVVNLRADVLGAQRTACDALRARLAVEKTLQSHTSGAVLDGYKDQLERLRELNGQLMQRLKHAEQSATPKAESPAEPVALEKHCDAAAADNTTTTTGDQDNPTAPADDQDRVPCPAGTAGCSGLAAATLHRRRRHPPIDIAAAGAVGPYGGVSKTQEKNRLRRAHDQGLCAPCYNMAYPNDKWHVPAPTTGA